MGVLLFPEAALVAAREREVVVTIHPEFFEIGEVAMETVTTPFNLSLELLAVGDVGVAAPALDAQFAAEAGKVGRQFLRQFLERFSRAVVVAYAARDAE
jgi:hypothetical protein